MDNYHDAMAGPGVPQVSRWDRQGSAAIRTLDAALVKCGLPDRLSAPLRLLAEAEDRAEQARARKQARAEQHARAQQLLLAHGPVDLDAYEETLLRGQLYLSPDAPAMGGLMEAARQKQANATSMTFGMVDALYAELQAACAEVVAQVGQVPTLPHTVWSAATSGVASTAAIRAGRTDAWSKLVQLGVKWDDIHDCAQLLRETGTLQAQLMFPGGCPERLGSIFSTGKALSKVGSSR